MCVSFIIIIITYLKFYVCTGKGAGQSEVDAVEKFGFSVKTCCGYLPQV